MTEPVFKDQELPLAQRTKLLQVSEQLEQRARELETLHRIGKSITSLLDLDELLTRIVEASVYITGAEEGYLLLVDEGTGELYLRAEQNLGEKHAQGFRVKVGDSITGSVVRTGEPLMINDEKCLKIVTGYLVKSLLNVPLKARDKVIGVFGVDNRVSDNAFSEENQYMLSMLADYAAIAIENARLLDEAKQRARNLETLRNLALTISSSLDLDETLPKVCQAAVEFFNADHSGFVLFDPSCIEGKVWAEYPSSGTLGTTIPLRGVVAEEQLIKAREPLGIYDVVGDESLGSVRDILLRFGIQSILIVPMVGKGGDLLGSFSLDAMGHRRQFTAEEIELCKVFAAQAAVAVENAWLFSQLGETKERLNSLIASSFDAVIAIDRDKKITVFNQRAEEMFGWTADEMKGRSVARLHDDFSKAQKIREVLDREGTITGWEIVLKHKDGTRIPTLLSAKLIRDTQGQPTGQAGFMRDLREMRLLEDRLRSLIQVSYAITHVLELDKVLTSVVDSAVAVFPAAQKGSIHLYDKKTGLLHIRASHGYSPEVEKTLTLKVGEGRAGWVYEHNTPLVVGSVQEDEKSRKIDCKIKHPEVQEQKSTICVPLAIGNRVIGTLSLDNVTTFNAFKPEDLGLLSIFAGQAATALMNAELMTKNRERLRKLEMLSWASNEMMSNLHSLSLDDRLDLVVRHAAQILDAEACTLFLVKRPGFLSKEASCGHHKDGFHKGREFAIRSGIGTGLIGHIANTGKLFSVHGSDLVEHWATTGKAPDHIASGKCCSLLAIPLKRRSGGTEELIGLLEAENKKDTDGQPKSHISFSKVDEWILSIFAETVVICLENAELYERTSDRLKEKVVSLKAIQETLAAISAELDLDELLELITKKAATVFGASAASLMLWDEREENLVVRAKHGLTDEYSQQRISRERVDATIASMGELHPLVTMDLCSTPYGRLDLIEAEHLYSVLSAPLGVSDSLIGILNIYSKDEPRQFTSDEIEVAEVFASQAAVAIWNAQLYEQLQQRANVLQALYDAGQTITASLELDIILNQIVQQAQRLTGRRGKEASFGDILLVDDGKLKAVSAFPEGTVDDLRSRFGSDIDLEKGVNGRIGITGRTIQTGESQLVRDVTQDPDFYQAYSGKTLSELAVPIKIGDEVIGVINVEHPDYSAFDEEDQKALESLATQAAIAIENARHFEDLKKIKGYIGSKTAVDWIRMVSTAWGHGVRREVGTALSHMALLRGQLARGESAQEIEKEIDGLENVMKRIKEIPITAPLSYEDAVDSVQINDLVKTHLERQWKHIRYEPLRLCFDLQEDLDSIATVRVSREWLRRALEILVDNSVQAMLEADSPEKRLTVTTRLVREMVEISVRDTGPGIPKDVLEKVFNEPIDKPVGSRGAGIGLILAQTIVQTYGGGIRVEPPSDRGTNMVIVLPVEN